MKLTIIIFFLFALLVHLFLSALAITQALKFSYLSQRTKTLTVIYCLFSLILIVAGIYFLIILEV